MARAAGGRLQAKRKRGRGRSWALYREYAVGGWWALWGGGLWQGNGSAVLLKGAAVVLS